MRSRLFFRSALGAVLLVLALSAVLNARVYGGANVRGTVSQQSRGPLRSVWVIVSQNGDERGRALTGDDGRYYIGNLDDGRGYEIRVEQQGRQRYKAQIRLPDNRTHNIVVP